ncbi:MAG: YdcF family protein [Candidatus Pacebacteria bacterium]|nr:YdcF family protein [Candidatus Paceibacterota bacterium]
MTEKEIDVLAKKIWDYHHMNQPLQKAQVIIVLGNRDTRVAEYAAQLYLDGYAPLLLCAGSGSIHNHKLGREQFVGTTEAEVFADVAMKMGVRKDAIIIENESQNTGQNYEFAIKKLKERHLNPKRIILVQKPYMERRTYATGKVWLPQTQLIVTSPQIPFEAYFNETNTKERVINTIVGDLQRIREYPKKGFAIEQEIPKDVWEAYEQLVKAGFTKHLIK